MRSVVNPRPLVTAGGPRHASGPGVALVDPVPLFREGLSALVKRTPGLHWLGSTGHLHTAVRLHDKLRPSVLLVDSVLDPQGHLATLLTGNDANLMVIALVREPHRTPDYVRTAMNAGVRGLVPRSAEAPEVVEAIIRTHRDRSYLHPSLAPMAAGLTGEAGPRRALSRREFEVLHLIADGLENQSVADELHLSVETVRSHIKNILRKLNARDRTHAVSLGYRAGLLAPHQPPSPRLP